jgi:hypothetical protein
VGNFHHHSTQSQLANVRRLKYCYLFGKKKNRN